MSLRRGILVWDNFSSNSELTRAQRSWKRGIRRWPSIGAKRNLGFGAGVNRAVAQLGAEGDFDYFWIVNPDMTVQPGGPRCDRQRHRTYMRDPAPLILWWHQARLVRGGSIPFSQGRSVHEFMGEEVGAWESTYGEVTFVTGAAPLIARSAWRKLGGFEENTSSIARTLIYPCMLRAYHWCKGSKASGGRARRRRLVRRG